MCFPAGNTDEIFCVLSKDMHRWLTFRALVMALMQWVHCLGRVMRMWDMLSHFTSAPVGGGSLSTGQAGLCDVAKGRRHRWYHTLFVHTGYWQLEQVMLVPKVVQ